MGPSLKKRKIIDSTSSRRTFNQSIGGFGKVTKAGAKEPGNKAKIVEIEAAPCESDSEREHKKLSCLAQSRESKKRRREDTESTQSRSLDDRSVNLVAAPAIVDGKSPSTPVKSRKKARIAWRTAVTDTPTKGARTFLESFAISSPRQKRSSSPALPSSSPLPIQSSSPPTSEDQESLSVEHNDLVSLHNAFLNALSLHYAHNGTSSPADIRHLIPSIERRWSKRRVCLEDFQRLLGVQQLQSDSKGAYHCLSLVDYGRSKICIECDSQSASTFPAEALRNAFSPNLRQLNHVESELPLAPITPFESEDRGPSKGALRLAEIRAGGLKALSTIHSAPKSESQSSSSFKLDSRAASLVDRIRMKEAHAASLPAPPSAEALARRAALMRLEEVIPVLEILSGSSSTSIASKNLYSSSSSQASLDALMKPSLSGLGASLGIAPSTPAKVVSFTLGNVIQHLQNSLKHPVSKEEAERCVRLLAKEVTPRWVGIREVGRVVGITFRGKIGRSEWTDRLRELTDNA